MMLKGDAKMFQQRHMIFTSNCLLKLIRRGKAPRSAVFMYPFPEENHVEESR